MKAGLVTFYHIHHYGALLQAAATERAVERFGWDCEIIDYFVNQDNALFKRPTGLGSAAHDAHTALHYQALSERYRRFEKFSRDHLRISDRRYGRFDELAGGPLPYDLILSGSDQIWNPKIFPDGRFDPVFFGTFSQKRRIAYAPSFGVPTIPEGMQAELKGYLDGFSHLSARETQGSAIIRDIAGKDAPVVLDPTLLLTADQWDSMADHPSNYPKGGYILCYCISRPGALTPYLERLHQETGLPVVQLCGIRQKVHPKAKQILDAGPAEFLGLFQNAAYVVTNSFHGTVFSVQFHRPFFTTVSPAELSAPERSRTVSILSRLGLANRVIGKGDTAELLDPVDWEAAEAALTAARKDSLNYLQAALEDRPYAPEAPLSPQSFAPKLAERAAAPAVPPAPRAVPMTPLRWSGTKLALISRKWIWKNASIADAVPGCAQFCRSAVRRLICPLPSPPGTGMTPSGRTLPPVARSLPLRNMCWRAAAWYTALPWTAISICGTSPASGKRTCGGCGEPSMSRAIWTACSRRSGRC